MLKRRQIHGSRMVLKRHRPNPTKAEWLPHDVVELILERLPVKSLMRLRFVSKKWRMTVCSQRFNERQFVRRRLSRGPDVLFVSLNNLYDPTPIVYPPDDPDIVLGSSSSILRRVSLPFHHLKICLGSCDGLLCIHCDYEPSVVVNPATQWHRTIPFSCVELLIVDKVVNKRELSYPPPCKLGFGKDIIRGTYKAVWLYNSSDFGLDKDGSVTTCEVFDFSKTNSWRYVAPSSPHLILPYVRPVYLDGSLYWITDCFSPNVLSFDLHTETFKLISDSVPPLDHCLPDPYSVVLCILDNRLCISEKTWDTQKIWSFSSSSRTWTNMCSFDLAEATPCFNKPFFAPYPIAILEKNKVLVHGRHYLEPAVLVDLHTKSYDLAFTPTTSGYSVYYFESLFSF